MAKNEVKEVNKNSSLPTFEEFCKQFDFTEDEAVTMAEYYAEIYSELCSEEAE